MQFFLFEMWTKVNIDVVLWTTILTQIQIQISVTLNFYFYKYVKKKYNVYTKVYRPKLVLLNSVKSSCNLSLNELEKYHRINNYINNFS